jgi:CBS domain containing-hemolysin-like protein
MSSSSCSPSAPWGSRPCGEPTPWSEAVEGPSLLAGPGRYLALVLLNGLFVAAEFAIIGVRPSRVEQLARKDTRSRAVCWPFSTHLDGKTGTSRRRRSGLPLLPWGLVCTASRRLPALSSRFWRGTGRGIQPAVLHSISFVLSLSFVTYLHVVSARWCPRRSRSTAERAVLWLARPMHVAQMILSPAVLILNSIGNGLLRLLRVPLAEGHARLHSPEELGLIVSESAEGGLLNEEEEEMILNIFDFGERQVGQVMTPRRKVQAIPVDMPVDDLLQLRVPEPQQPLPRI